MPNTRRASSIKHQRVLEIKESKPELNLPSDMPPPPPPAHQNVSMYPGDQPVDKQMPINSSQTCLWDQQTAPPTSTATVDVHLHENYQSGNVTLETRGNLFWSK